MISVFYKDGITELAQKLTALGATIYSTGGTEQHLRNDGVPVVPMESVTGYPSILGGRVKTLHPKVFGGILSRRQEANDRKDLETYSIPEIDLVIVDLYPFEDTLRKTDDEKAIIEKIDIGGPSMIRAAAKNFAHVAVLLGNENYTAFGELLQSQNGHLTLSQRRSMAARAFEVVKDYDIAISDYFSGKSLPGKTLRYGENPHQSASFQGELNKKFRQVHGKELSYNNLVDTDAAIQLIEDLRDESEAVFVIIKHTNVCGIAVRSSLPESWSAALASDPESAFGGVLVCNRTVCTETAAAVNGIFFEVLIAPAFDPEALLLLTSKKNRILLEKNREVDFSAPTKMSKSLLGGVLEQSIDKGNFAEWTEKGGRETTASEKIDLSFANLVCKHLKSNAIAIVANKQLIGKGCGQTSRVDALRQALEKAKTFGFSLEGAVLASDAFFPFDDCVKLAAASGIKAFIQPGGSVRDGDSINYCVENQLAMVMTGLRHFRH